MAEAQLTSQYPGSGWASIMSQQSLRRPSLNAQEEQWNRNRTTENPTRALLVTCGSFHLALDFVSVQALVQQ
jgi:hypothetical protein